MTNVIASNYLIKPSVSSNNLTVALKTLANADASASAPIIQRIAGLDRLITGALSLTVNAGANTFNAGSAELATKEIDYFVYLAWITASNAVALLVSRIPYATLYSDFSTTATNEKYAAYSAQPAATDEVVCVGRFAATLSAGAGYTWTVPTFTAANLIQRPIYETRRLTWTPAWSANGSMTYTSVSTDIATYQIVGQQIKAFIRASGTIGGTPNTTVSATAPFNSAIIATAGETGNGTADSVGSRNFMAAGTPNAMSFQRYDIGNWTAGAGRVANGNFVYWIT